MAGSILNSLSPVGNVFIVFAVPALINQEDYCFVLSAKRITNDHIMSPLSMELNKVSSSNKMWQGHQEVDLIAPCKEKLQLLLNCCQDVAQVVETLEAHMQSTSGRPQETAATLVVDDTEIELRLLREELRRSKLHNEELEIAKISMEKKIAGMEETIQALSAQLMVYKEDFDLERRDRERAQGRLAEFEQQLLFYQRPYEPSRSTREPCAANVQSSVFRQQQHHHYLSNELMPRGRDVCDDYQTDGVGEEVEKIEERPVVMPCTATDGEQELRAQSFNISDFFPVTVNAEKSVNGCSANLHDVSQEAVVEDGGNATERDTLCTDGVELPLPRTGLLGKGKSVASPPGRPLVDQYKPQQDLYHPLSWSFLTERPTDSANGNFYQADSSVLLPENTLEESHLMCPKCHKRFSCRDHLRLLDHLEEC